MASRQDTATFILEQLGRPDRFSVRPMFGEFALYADGKVVGLICNDQLYVKVLHESSGLERTAERAAPFPGAKDYYLVPEGGISGHRSLPDVLIRMAAVLPYPKAKKTKRR